VSYLTAASLSKAESLVDFTLVRVGEPLAEPRRIARMRVALSGTGRPVPSDSLQRCVQGEGEATCDVTPAASSPAENGNDPRYLASTFPVPARNPAVAALAREIAGSATDSRTRVTLVVAWMDANVKKSPVDLFSALDVLTRREAECQGHAWLYAALARALGIPTRVVNGLVYSENHRGFLYHAWAESLVDGRWLAVDPTFGAVPADATHV
jgi:transglutaminase-like putative cysteine protease